MSKEEWTKLWLGSQDHQLAITRSVVINTPLQAGKTRARGKTGGAVSFNHDGSLLGVATFFSFADTVTSDTAHHSSFIHPSQAYIVTIIRRLAFPVLIDRLLHVGTTLIHTCQTRAIKASSNPCLQSDPFPPPKD